MADLICFYQDVLTNRPPQINDFDYRDAVLKLQQTYKKFNKGQFTLISDFATEKLDSQFDSYRLCDLNGLSLMENVCIANCFAVANNPGRYILCGCDHLINGKIDNMFDGTFDIGIMLVKGRVNNTIILVDTVYEQHVLVEEFFNKRLSIYQTLNSDMKKWGGDQMALTQLLASEGILPEKKNKNRVYDCMGLRIKLFDYKTNGTSGVSKSGPVYDKASSFIDFKGPLRKKHFDQVYTYIMLKSS